MTADSTLFHNLSQKEHPAEGESGASGRGIPGLGGGAAGWRKLSLGREAAGSGIPGLGGRAAILRIPVPDRGAAGLNKEACLETWIIGLVAAGG